jgi:hypothetical protein
VRASPKHLHGPLNEPEASHHSGGIGWHTVCPSRRRWRKSSGEPRHCQHARDEHNQACGRAGRICGCAKSALRRGCRDLVFLVGRVNQLEALKTPKSLSVEHSIAPCSMARAASAASVTSGPLTCDPDLLDRLNAFKPVRYDGVVFRATRQGLDPLTGSYPGGRWIPRDVTPVLQPKWTMPPRRRIRTTNKSRLVSKLVIDDTKR